MQFDYIINCIFHFSLTVYKTCVETELSSIMKEIGAFKGLPQDESFVTLQHKHKIAKREVS